ncbi:MAG TPA: PhoD-like phosphatase, partial [Coleofasciculaceae cyanobacterium]
MVWMPLSDRLAQLPLILAGPILRRTQPDTVTVWVALRESCAVTLAVFATEAGQGAALQDLALAGIQATVPLGQHLHVVALTARSVNGAYLQPGQVYAYDLSFERLNSDQGDRPTLQQALRSEAFPWVPISYFEHGLPTFALPPEQLDSLKIVQGSCRKPHGGEQDTLPILDSLIEQNACQANDRPHQLFLTGDQIYGDDVADALLWQLTDAGNTLLGWEEALPTASQAGRDLAPKQLKAGQRSRAAEQWAGFTAGLGKKPACDRSHLFGLGEYYAIYLFSWSQVLWSPSLPTVQDMGGTQSQARYWHQEARALQDFVHTLWKARRALANVPTYMIFDDHDISDDWYLNQAWCLRVLSQPLGRRTVQNGLLAYAIFQAWGNTPEQFQHRKPGARLLAAAEDWSASAGTDTSASDAIARYLGLPPATATGLPALRLEGEVWVLDRDRETLQWHYAVRSSCHEVVVLDTRTWRGYPAGDAPVNAPPRLLSPTAFDRQILKPLQETDLLKKEGKSTVTATLVIAPTNLVSLRLIDWIQHWNLRQGDTFKNDVGDAWNINTTAFGQLLGALFARRDRVIVLSGDIHYGSAVRMDYWERPKSGVDPSLSSSPPSKVLVQLTSSALKNSELKTRLVHTKLKSLLPEPPQDWLGWTQQIAEPADGAIGKPAPQDNLLAAKFRQRAIKRPTKLKRWLQRSGTSAIKDADPDWRYRIQWLKRQP